MSTEQQAVLAARTEEVLKHPDVFLPVLLQIKNAIEQGGLEPFLRARGRAKVHLGPDAIHNSALSNAWSAGWNDMLDTLLYFSDIYISEMNKPEGPPRLDFGGLSNAVTKKYLTKEEEDAIRAGKQPQYTNKISPELPKRPAPREPVGSSST